MTARKKAGGNFLWRAIISQVVFVVLMLLTVFIIKFCDKGLYGKIKNEYTKRFSVETTIEQVLDEVDKNEV